MKNKQLEEILMIEICARLIVEIAKSIDEEEWIGVLDQLIAEGENLA